MSTLIGLTGQTGAGKSQVCSILREYGFDTIDADIAAREVARPGGECLSEITAEFGEGILLPGGALDRRKLGDIVFGDEARLKALETIIFPHVKREIGAKVEVLRGKSKGVFLDAPTLFESGTDKSCDKIVSVLAPPALRMRRIMERDNLSEREAGRRMRSQHGDEWYASRSDFIIRNDKGDADLRGEVRGMIDALFP